MPVSGKVIEINVSLTKEPELVNKDAFGKGWMIKIELSDSGQVENLLSTERYKQIIRE